MIRQVELEAIAWLPTSAGCSFVGLALQLERELAVRHGDWLRSQRLLATSIALVECPEQFS